MNCRPVAVRRITHYAVFFFPPLDPVPFEEKTAHVDSSPR